MSSIDKFMTQIRFCSPTNSCKCARRLIAGIVQFSFAVCKCMSREEETLCNSHRECVSYNTYLCLRRMPNRFVRILRAFRQTKRLDVTWRAVTHDASYCLAAKLKFTSIVIGETFYRRIIFREKSVTKWKYVINRDCRIIIHLEKLVVARLLRKIFFQCSMESGTSFPCSQVSTTPPGPEPVEFSPHSNTLLL
jgi:hypothetical protein